MHASTVNHFVAYISAAIDNYERAEAPNYTVAELRERVLNYGTGILRTWKDSEILMRRHFDPRVAELPVS